MAVGVIARLIIHEGMNEAFETEFLHYQHQVKSSEAGNVFFSLHRSRMDPCSYTVLEQYQDEAALQAHMNAAYYKAIPETFGGFMAGAPDIEYLDAVE